MRLHTACDDGKYCVVNIARTLANTPTRSSTRHHRSQTAVWLLGRIDVDTRFVGTQTKGHNRMYCRVTCGLQDAMQSEKLGEMEKIYVYNEIESDYIAHAFAHKPNRMVRTPQQPLTEKWTAIIVNEKMLFIFIIDGQHSISL